MNPDENKPENKEFDEFMKERMIFKMLICPHCKKKAWKLTVDNKSVILVPMKRGKGVMIFK